MHSYLYTPFELLFEIYVAKVETSNCNLFVLSITVFWLNIGNALSVEFQRWLKSLYAINLKCVLNDEEDFASCKRYNLSLYYERITR